MKVIIKPFLISVFSLSFFILNAQNVGINSTGATANASALLDVEATDKGILIPRVSLSSTIDVATVATPATNLLVFNTNASITNGNGTGFYYYNGGSWTYMAAPSNGPGTSGEVLTSQGPGTAPEWATSGGGSCLPAAISNSTWLNVNFTACATNCTNLSEGGFTDWRIPTFKEYVYARFNFPTPTGGWISDTNFLTTSNTSTSWLLFQEQPSNGEYFGATSNSTDPRACRCIR